MALLRKLAFAARLVALMAAVVVLLDALVFRSGFYLRWLEPQSVAGSTRNAVRRVEATISPGRRNVLVMGNSKIGEGLSTALADATTEGSGLHFVSGFIPGSALRIWYSLLREIDPQANRGHRSGDPARPDLGFVAAHPGVLIIASGSLAWCLLDRSRRLQDWLVERAPWPLAALGAGVVCLAMEFCANVDIQIPFVYFQF